VPTVESGGGLGLTGVLAAVVGGLILLVMILSGTTLLDVGALGGLGGGSVSPIGQVGAIPSAYVPMYNAAAQQYGVSPYVLASIHDEETSFGSSLASGVHYGLNFAGCCAGPMQFSVISTADTWDGYATAYQPIAAARPASYPLQSATHPSVYDSFDAIAAAAKLLHADGADASLDSQRTWQAIWDYNHADWYVNAVLARARQWAQSDQLATMAPAGPLPLTGGASGTVLPGGLAAAPTAAPTAVKAMVAAGNRLYGQPYLFGGGHGYSLDVLSPNGYDCSSSISYLLHAGGALGATALTSTQFETWGAPGPGRWVTIYANSGHAFMYVAGLRMDTSHDGTDVGPNAGQDGPRWRVLDHVPDWAQWVVVHPPGL
jgi:hypothetical protein